MTDLSGKTAIVTGNAKGGIGHAIARNFLEQGASVVVSEISPGKLAQSLADLETLGPVVGVQANVSVRADAEKTVQTAIDTFGQLDILVNNAAYSTTGIPFTELDDTAIARTLGASLLGTIYHMQAAYPHLKKTAGCVVNFGSRAGVMGEAGNSVYAAAKEGIRGLSRAAAREWGADRIRVNTICPAAMSPGAEIWWNNNPQIHEQVLGNIALGYFGNAYDDIAPVVMFLVSEDARYMTGQTINVEGGQTMP